MGTWATVTGPGGALKASSWRLGWAFNRGWRWGISVPLGSLVPTFAASSTFAMTVNDGRGAIIASPQLIAVGPRALTWGDQGPEIRIEGTDLTTQRLALKGQNFDTFRNTNASSIAAAIGTRGGVSISNAPTFPVFEEDIKQSSLGEPLKRLATIDASQLLIDAGGGVNFTPYGWTASSWDFKASGGTWNYDPSKRITEITFVKQTSMEQAERDLVFDSAGWKMQALPQPLSNIVPIDRSSMGAVVTIGFWSGDPSGGGALISYWPMGIQEGAFLGVPTSGTWPATHITCSIMEPSPPFDALPIAARLKLAGSSPNSIPAGIDLAFEYTYNSGATPSLPADSVVSEALYPSLAHVTAKAPQILWDINKDSNEVTCSGPLDCSGQVGDSLTPMPIYDHEGNQAAITPSAQVFDLEHAWSGGDSEPTTSVTAYALP